MWGRAGGDTTTSLCSLFQCLLNLKVKKFFLRVRWNFLFVCARCPLSCCWAPVESIWPPPLDTHPKYTFALIKSPFCWLFSGLIGPDPSERDAPAPSASSYPCSFGCHKSSVLLLRNYLLWNIFICKLKSCPLSLEFAACQSGCIPSELKAYQHHSWNVLLGSFLCKLSLSIVNISATILLMDLMKIQRQSFRWLLENIFTSMETWMKMASSKVCSSKMKCDWPAVESWSLSRKWERNLVNLETSR